MNTCLENILLNPYFTFVIKGKTETEILNLYGNTRQTGGSKMSAKEGNGNSPKHVDKVVNDTLGLADVQRVNKTAFVQDVMTLAEQILVNKTLQVTDTLTLKDVITAFARAVTQILMQELDRISITSQERESSKIGISCEEQEFDRIKISSEERN